MTLYYKIRQILLQNATAILLQNATDIHYKCVRFFIPKCDSFITKCDDFITKCDSYRKMRRLLQIVTVNVFWNIHFLPHISNKYWLPNKPAKKVFLQKTPYTSPSFQERIFVLHCRNFRNIIFFTIFLLVLRNELGI